jgi:hypothetical protein
MMAGPLNLEEERVKEMEWGEKRKFFLLSFCCVFSQIQVD